MNMMFNVILDIQLCSSALLMIFNSKLLGVDSATHNLSTDKEALMAFKSQLNLESLNQLSSWNQNSSPCSNWTGIVCDQPNQRVVSINLSGLKLSGSISPQIGNLSFLESLQLQNNYFTGTLPVQTLNLIRLRVLNMSTNSITGVLQLNTSLLSELRVLNLVDNQLSGQLPEEISHLAKLQIFKLAKNKFSGLIPPTITNLSSLTTLDFNTNAFSGRIPSELSRLQNLNILDFSINQLSGTVPPSLYNITSLHHFNLASNQLHGILPSNIDETLPNIVFFRICFNNFTGSIPRSLHNLTNIVQLRLSNCHFHGTLPPGLANLPDLEMYNIGYNRIVSSGDDGLSFITDLTNSTRLKFLAIDDNLLEGRIPNSIGNLSKDLNRLYLGGNHIYGGIPAAISLLKGLTSLNLSHNMISGEIPPELEQIENLQLLNLEKNRIWGQIPDSLGNLQMLSEIDLSGNELVGRVPAAFKNFERLQSMDLSSNRLNGSIPREILGLQSLSGLLNLSNNKLTGPLPEEVGILEALVAIDLSDNQLSGNIPSSIGNCKSLEKLYMGNNFFSGYIPKSFGEVKGLDLLDLSSNQLSGLIPVELEKLQVLQFLNLSFNNLEGEIPSNGIFKNTSRFEVDGNPRLQMYADEKKDKGLVDNLALAGIIIAAVAILCFLVIGTKLYLKRSKKMNAERFNFVTAAQHQKISFEQLRAATGNFNLENLIGKGSFGSVYKGSISEGISVAVKALDTKLTGSWKSFLAECEALRYVRHRNLVKLITSCSSVDFKNEEFLALVYEFMSNGNLEEWIKGIRTHEDGEGLNFVERLNVAIDVASAIAYLHHECKAPVVHCDLKPSNILLDDNLTAKVGDFGIAKLLIEKRGHDDSSISSLHGLKGSIGYIPPEYGVGEKPSSAGDVYSYGVMLLELFTGKSPTSEEFMGGTSIVKWVKSAFPINILQVMDTQLLLQMDSLHCNDEFIISPESQNDAMTAVLEVGLSCTGDSSYGRITMRDVLCKLKNAKEKLLDHVDVPNKNDV